MSRMADLDAAIRNYRQARHSLEKIVDVEHGESPAEQIARDVLVDSMMALCITAADELVETLYPGGSDC